jgi:hypothetical protein
MQIDAGEALRRGWAQSNLVCEHRELVEEHDAENRLTGKQFCKVCGQYQDPPPAQKESEDKKAA